MIFPRFIRVLVSPAEVFTEIANEGRGFGDLFYFLAAELLLMAPLAVVTHVMRASYDIPGAVLGVWGAYVNFALRIALGVFVLGIVLYYRLRKSPQRLEVWAAASVLTYAWVPHVLLVALGVIATFMGFDHAILPQYDFGHVQGVALLGKCFLEFAPSLVLAVIAVRSVVRRTPPLIDADKSAPAATSNVRVGSHRMWASAALCIVVVAGATGVNAKRIADDWPSARPVMPGDSVPSFHAQGLNGGTVTHSGVLGDVALIDFWATWCGPCRAAMPHLEEIHQKFGDKGLRMVSINTEPDNRPGVKNFVEKNELSFPVYIDGGSMRNRFHVQSYPSVFLVDRKGIVREVHIGNTSMVTLENEVKQLLAEGGS